MRRRRIRISIFVRLFTKSVAAGPYQLNPTQLKVVKSTEAVLSTSAYCYQKEKLLLSRQYLSS